MPLTLFLVTALAAVVACAAAIRTRRAVGRLSRALAREWDLRASGAAGARGGDPEQAARLAQTEAWLQRSVEALEQRLREVLARTAEAEARLAAPAPLARSADVRGASPRIPPGDAASPARDVNSNVRERIRERLAADGYEEIVVLPGRNAKGGYTFEARQEGMPAKGAAHVDAEGRLVLRHAGPLRAFP